MSALTCNWCHPPTQPTLPCDEIHVWRASLDLPEAQVQQLAQTLTPDEVERAGRFRFARDRQRFVVARGLLRKLLGGYLGVSPQHLRLAYTRFGKPSLDTMPREPPLHFNLSHSHGLALYSVACHVALGIDVERIRTDLDYEEIAKRFFSPAEQAKLKGVPGRDKPLAFFNCWTRKEAFMKACGQGLSFPLDQFEVSLRPDEPAQLLRLHGSAAAAEGWSLRALTVRDGYAAALAVEGSRERLVYWQVEAESDDQVCSRESRRSS